MSERRPFIKKFTNRRKDGFFYYDVNTNKLSALPEVAWHLLDDLYMLSADLLSKWKATYSPDEIEANMRLLRKLQREEQVFSATLPEHRQRLPTATELESLSTRNGCVLHLCLTESCNLRCRYCIFEDVYAETRAHQPRTFMAVDTARKAVDWYARRLSDKHTLFVYFWGGEPLLNWQPIEAVFLYLDEAYPTNAKEYAVATNGMLLTEHIAAQFEKHGVEIHLSIDGPKELHDRNRVSFAARGSHDLVVEKLALLRRQCSEDYLKKKLILQTTMTSEHDVKLVRDYFDTNYPEYRFTGSAMKMRTARDETSEEYNKKQLAYTKGCIDLYFDEVAKGNLEDSKYFAWAVKKVSRLADRDLTPLGGVAQLKEPCSLGSSPMVAPDGGLFFCNATDKNYPIGDIERGIDYERLHAMQIEYDAFQSTYCTRCWFQRFCTACFIHGGSGNGQLSAGHRHRTYCAPEKEKFERILECVVSVEDGSQEEVTGR